MADELNFDPHPALRKPPPTPLMRVSDLIAHLQTLPQDYPVLAYNGTEDFSPLNLESVELCGDGEVEWYHDCQFRADAHVRIGG